ncbi:MAG: hypothetical protein AAGA91_08980 [Pseudomonadota bacterium]
MAINRRNLIKSGSTLLAGSVVSGVARAGLKQNAPAFDQAYAQTFALVKQTLDQAGLKEIPPLPLVSGQDHINGGLRQDANPAMLQRMTYTLQPSARVDDIAERGRTDLLPIFHVLASHTQPDTTFADQAHFLMTLLTDICGLDKQRLAFASVPDVEQMRELLTLSGIDFDRQVHIRAPEVARGMGDSSGYFFPDPEDNEYHILTCGVYYRLTDEGDVGFATYPPPAEWTEVAEFGLTGIESPGIALGMERLTLARSGFYPTWSDRLPMLMERVGAESGNDAPPPGLDAFR